MLKLVLGMAMGASVVLAGCACGVPAPDREAADPAGPTLSAHGQQLVNEAAVALVRVTLAGEIHLNGREVSLEELNTAFSELKQRNGIVYYYRDAPELDPPRAAMEVMAAVFDAGLPIRRAAEPDFSDAMEPDAQEMPDGAQPQDENETLEEDQPSSEGEVAGPDQSPGEERPADNESEPDKSEPRDEDESPAPDPPAGEAGLPNDERTPGEEQTSDEPSPQ